MPRTPLTDSPAIGTSASDLIVPCADGRSPRPAVPPPPEQQPAFALALSGGGFRATISAVGVLRFLADAGLLGRVRYVSSVSGGSVANGLLALAHPRLEADGFTREAVDRHVVEPLLRKVSRRSFKWKLIRNAWRTIGPTTRTQVLARMFDDWWLERRALADLPAGVRWIFNAGNLTTGVRFAFERDVVGDYVIGRVATSETELRLAEAVAASAAVPGAFAPYELPGIEFPCLNGQEVRLLDGGTYDNSGLGALDSVTDPCLVALNAGGLFHVGRYGRVPVLRDLLRAEALLYRQSTALRRKMLVDQLKAWEDARDAGRPAPEGSRQGVLFGLASTVPATDEWLAERPEFPHGADALRDQLAELHTTFDLFPHRTCEELVHRGWWLTGATMSLFHRDLLPAQLPRWEPLS